MGEYEKAEKYKKKPPQIFYSMTIDYMLFSPTIKKTVFRNILLFFCLYQWPNH